MITLRLALGGQLAHDFSATSTDFWERERENPRVWIEWLKRSARSMLDIYGNARDGRVLPDSEAQRRAQA